MQREADLDVALQFLGNLFEYFLVRRNEGNVLMRSGGVAAAGSAGGSTVTPPFDSPGAAVIASLV